MQVTLNLLFTHRQCLHLFCWEKSTPYAIELWNIIMHFAKIRKLTPLSRSTQKYPIVSKRSEQWREWRRGEFISGALRSDDDWQKSSQSRERNHVRGQSRHESEDSRAGQFQQPVSFHNNSQLDLTMRRSYTPQNNEQPLNNCIGWTL